MKSAAPVAFIITLLTPIPSGAAATGAIDESRTGNLPCNPDRFQEGRLHGSRKYGCRISLWRTRPAGQELKQGLLRESKP